MLPPLIVQTDADAVLVDVVVTVTVWVLVKVVTVLVISVNLVLVRVGVAMVDQKDFIGERIERALTSSDGDDGQRRLALLHSRRGRRGRRDDGLGADDYGHCGRRRSSRRGDVVCSVGV